MEDGLTARRNCHVGQTVAQVLFAALGDAEKSAGRCGVPLLGEKKHLPVADGDSPANARRSVGIGYRLVGGILADADADAEFVEIDLLDEAVDVNAGCVAVRAVEIDPHFVADFDRVDIAVPAEV
jgi:hypothetical protein